MASGRQPGCRRARIFAANARGGYRIEETNARFFESVERSSVNPVERCGGVRSDSREASSESTSPRPAQTRGDDCGRPDAGRLRRQISRAMEWRAEEIGG